MTPLSSKLPHVGTTIFTVMSQRAAELGAINLAQGFPDYDPPALLKARLGEAAAGSSHQYAPMTGLRALRVAIATQFARTHGVRPDPDLEVTITLGATEALFSAIQALVHPGDEVLVLDPAYDSYAPAIGLAGGTPLHVPLVPPAFRVDWQLLRSRVTPRTRMVIVNSPHNPTGAVCDAADLDQLADALEGTDVLVLADEVYEHIVFDGRVPLSCGAHPRLKDRTVACFSFGKALHATGWRVGYAIATPMLAHELRKVHQFNTFSIATPLQQAIADFLRSEPGFTAQLGAFYQRKRDLFLGLLAGSRFKAVPVSGTYFQLLDYSAISSLRDTAFAEQLLVEHGVASIPVSPFCVTPPDLPLLRFCFAKTDATLQAAADRLRRL